MNLRHFMNIEIVEIIGRSTQGVSRPFTCKGDDGNLYWVKTLGWNPKDLLAEWICGNLAIALNLPVPECKLVCLSKDLVDKSLIEDNEGLWAGVGFGSLHMEGDEIKYNDIEKIDVELKRKILFFDWLVLNDDRIFGSNGGNPNLLYNPVDNTIIVIDHNNAFSSNFNCDRFWDEHIFGSAKDLWDADFKSAMTENTKLALSKINCLFDNLPDDWHRLDEIEGKTTLDEIISTVRNTLNRFQKTPDIFWEGKIP